MSRFPLLAVILILIPAIEIFTFVQVGQSIGYFVALLLLVVMTLLGSYMLRLQGLSTMRNIITTVTSGQSPTYEVMEGIMVGVSAIFLLIPGFISDLIGLSLLIPLTRRWILKMFISRKLRASTSNRNYQDVQVNIIEPEKITLKPHGQTSYDYEGEYIRKDK